MHFLLSNYAYQELCSILGQDYGHDSQMWKKYINEMNFPTALIPRKKKTIEL